MNGENTDFFAARTVLVDRLLEEAARIGEAARDQLTDLRPDLPPVAKLRAQQEIGLIATCLGFSVAWLLEQKAIAQGELDAATAGGEIAVHATSPDPDPMVVGAELAALGREARAFGRRIHRLAAH